MPGSRVIPMKTPLTRELQMGYLPRSPGTPVRHFTLASFLQVHDTHQNYVLFLSENHLKFG